MKKGAAGALFHVLSPLFDHHGRNCDALMAFSMTALSLSLALGLAWHIPVIVASMATSSS